MKKTIPYKPTESFSSYIYKGLFVISLSNYCFNKMESKLAESLIIKSQEITLGKLNNYFADIKNVVEITRSYASTGNINLQD